MKYFLLILALLPIGVGAEQIVKTPFSGMEGAYQLTEGNGIFYKADNSSAAVYDKQGNSIDSATHASNTSFTNIAIPNAMINIAYNGTYNYSKQFSTATIDLANQEIKGAYQYGFPGIGGTNVWHGVTSNGGCQTYKRFKIAATGGKIVIYVYANNGAYCTGGGNTVQTDIEGANAGLFESFTGSIDTSQMVDSSVIDNNYIQVIGNDWLLYKKTSDDGILYQLVCNDFNVCTESEFLNINITNGGYIKNFQHIYNETSNSNFGGLNINVGDATSGNLQFGEYEFDATNTITGIKPFEVDKWIIKVFEDVNDLKIFYVAPIENATNGLDYQMAQRPLIIFDEDLIGSDLDFWYIRDDELYNFDSTFNGTAIDNSNGGGGSGTGGGGGSTGSGFLDVVWDGDGDGEIGIGEAITGFGNTIVGIFSAVGDFFTSLYELITKLNEVFTTEEKTFSFIPTASAAESDYLTNMFPDKETGGYNDTVLGKMEKFFYAAIFMIIFIIGIAGFISINRD